MIKKIYSVGQANSYIKNMFAQDFMMHRIGVSGEVSNCKYHTSGHIYFTLKDGNSALNAIMFAGNRKGLTFSMKDGDKVIVTGSIEVYERDGRYQLYAKEITPAGEGELYLRFEALKKELEEMGMFAPEYKKAIPQYANKIGVVTAKTGAAIQDIINISYRRNPYVQLILFPALVQGEGAAVSIVNGIHALDHLGVDVIIVGRGGGSIEDLWAFNEEVLARAVFECETPIISAVGHETDTTIIDYVSDMRAPTPSAAAELAVYDIHIVEDEINRLRNRMNRSMTTILQMAKGQMLQYQTRLKYLNPVNRLHEKKQYLIELYEKLNRMMQEILLRKKNTLQLLARNLDGLSPAKRLGQGYSFVTAGNGVSLRDIHQVKTNDEIQVYVTNGIVHAKVVQTIDRRNIT